MGLFLAYGAPVGAVQLDWQAPAGCPTTEALLKDVRRLAGSNDSDSLTARAIVAQTVDGRWRVAIDLSGSATGHRTLTADSCTQLARASALIVALAANPDAALDLANDDVSPPQSPPAVESSPKSVAQPPNPPTPIEHLQSPAKPTVAEPSRTESVSAFPSHNAGAFVVASRAGYESGSLPTPTGWLGLGARASHSHVPIGGAALLYVTQATSATFTDIGVGADFRAFGAHTVLCAEPLRRRWYLASCGGMQLTVVRVKGFADTTNLSQNGFERAVTFTRFRWIAAPLVAVVTGLEFSPRLVAELGASVAVPTTRWQFVAENVGTMFRAAAVQYSFFFGLGLRLD